MSCSYDDPGGGNGIASSSVRAIPATSVWAGGKNGENVRMRSFEEIVTDAKSNRNILEIHLKKNLDENDANKKPANITFDQFGELLFDVLKINSDECVRINYASHRYDTREVVLKPSVDLSPYIKEIEEFYGHSVSTKRQSSLVTRVSFRNVPLNVPDEEIIHLCSFYGKPLKNVEYERIANPKFNGISGSTRYVDMELHPGKSFSNFYWMEGPLPGDQGCRITVLHSGQNRQCSNCLKTFSEGCPAQGQGKVCKEMGEKMTRMLDYMLDLKRKTGYESLKAAYCNKYPALAQKEATTFPDAENTGDELYSTCDMKEKDELISKLEKEVEESRQSAHSATQKLHQAVRSSELAKNKMATATECLTMYLTSNLKNDYFDEFNPVFLFLVSQFSSLLPQPEGYTVNPESMDVELSDNLFKNIIDAEPAFTEKITLFKSHLLEKLKLDLTVRKERRLSSGLTRARSLSNSTKRPSEEKKSGKTKIARPSQSS